MLITWGHCASGPPLATGLALIVLPNHRRRNSGPTSGLNPLVLGTITNHCTMRPILDVSTLIFGLTGTLAFIFPLSPPCFKIMKIKTQVKI